MRYNRRTMLVLALIPLLLTHFTANPQDVRLKKSTLKSHQLIPLAAEHEIKDHLPVELVGAEMLVEIRRKDLRIDTDGDGALDLTVSPRKPKVVDLTVGPSRKRVLVFRKDGRWMACSASLLTAKIKRQEIELLDADLDGDFGGANDWVRWRSGTFFRQNDSRLLATEEGLARYEILDKANKPQLSFERLPRPEEANDLQWKALLTVNNHRNQGGLAPWTLDLDRSSACQEHAEYLYLNNYDYNKPWDGVGSHSQTPGNPGFSKEGLKAAKNSLTSGTADAAGAIDLMMCSMLHRTGYLGPAEGKFAVGAVDRSQNTASGYSVLWGEDPIVLTRHHIVVYPGPGQTITSLEVKAERPSVESNPRFYDTQRGYPISVSFSYLPLKDVRLALFDEKTGKTLPGDLFTPEKPIHSTRRRNTNTAFFVADKPLSANSTFRAEFDALENDEPIRLVWWFKT